MSLLIGSARLTGSLRIVMDSIQKYETAPADVLIEFIRVLRTPAASHGGRTVLKGGLPLTNTVLMGYKLLNLAPISRGWRAKKAM